MKLLRGWLGVVILTLLVTAALVSVATWLGTHALAWLGNLEGVWNLWPGSTSFPGLGNEDTETYTTTIPVGTADTLRLANVAGRVTVETGAPGQVEITAVKRARGTAAQTRQVLELLQVQVEAGPNEIKVITEPGNRWPNNSSVDYRVLVPDGFGVKVNNVTGTIEVSGVTGPVTISNVTGTVDVDTKGPVQELSVKVVTGRITARFLPVPGGTYHLATTTGNVMAEVPAGVGIDARLSVVTGRISPGPGPWEIHLVDSRRFEGTAAGGGSRLTVSTVTGNVTLERR